MKGIVLCLSQILRVAMKEWYIRNGEWYCTVLVKDMLIRQRFLIKKLRLSLRLLTIAIPFNTLNCILLGHFASIFVVILAITAQVGSWVNFKAGRLAHIKLVANLLYLLPLFKIYGELAYRIEVSDLKLILIRENHEFIAEKFKNEANILLYIFFHYSSVCVDIEIPVACNLHKQLS